MIISMKQGEPSEAIIIPWPGEADGVLVFTEIGGSLDMVAAQKKVEDRGYGSMDLRFNILIPMLKDDTHFVEDPSTVQFMFAASDGDAMWEEALDIYNVHEMSPIQKWMHTGWGAASIALLHRLFSDLVCMTIGQRMRVRPDIFRTPNTYDSMLRCMAMMSALREEFPEDFRTGVRSLTDQEVLRQRLEEWLPGFAEYAWIGIIDQWEEMSSRIEALESAPGTDWPERILVEMKLNELCGKDSIYMHTGFLNEWCESGFHDLDALRAALDGMKEAGLNPAEYSLFNGAASMVVEVVTLVRFAERTMVDALEEARRGYNPEKDGRDIDRDYKIAELNNGLSSESVNLMRLRIIRRVMEAQRLCAEAGYHGLIAFSKGREAL